MRATVFKRTQTGVLSIHRHPSFLSRLLSEYAVYPFFLSFSLFFFIPNPNNPIPRLGHVRPFKLARRGRAQHAGGTQTTIIETSKLITHLLGGCNADEKENVCALKALTSPSSPAPLPPFLF